jgi:carbon storage regulator
MLVLTRKYNESIVVGADIVITIVGIQGDRVKLGVTAPSDLPVHRQEVYEDIQRNGHRPGPVLKRKNPGPSK